MTERDFRKEWCDGGKTVWSIEDSWEEDLLEAYEARGERIEELERELQREKTISASWKKLFTKCSKRELDHMSGC